jgi:branched-chain amino acid transport system ATP-binding protein
LATPEIAPAELMNGDGREPLLEVSSLRAGYASRPVVFDVDLHVGKGEVVVILGPNGAGKTTTLKAIFGLIRPLGGKVVFDGDDVTRVRAWSKVKRNVSFIPSERFVFGELDVAENLDLGAHAGGSGARTERLERVQKLFPVLGERLKQKARTMSGGEQRMLSLGISLMSAPRLLMLDEPSLGLAPAVVQSLMETTKELVERDGLSVLMVEQNVGQALRIADRVYVMRSGRIIHEESAAKMQARDQWWDLF